MADPDLQTRGSESIDSFYHLRDVALNGLCCRGLACFAARNDMPEHWQAAIDGAARVHCLGKCHEAPAMAGHDRRPLIAVHARAAVLLKNLIAGGVHDLRSYVARDGGALARARSLAPDALTSLVEQSGLRGRGGAGFPAGKKWRAVAAARGAIKYVVANADEGDPGAFSDRYLMEDDPFRLIEGMAIAARAVGAGGGYIYLRKEYPAAADSLAAALVEARAAGWLGPGFDIQLVVGHGSYVCGEETSMLNAIEGRRPEVRLRPPQITERGLFGAPTLVNNVETFCALPWIVEHGAEAYHALGFSRSRGTKLLSLNSLFQRPGLYEVEFGITLKEIVDTLGGGLKRGALLGLMVGGPLAGLLPPRLLGTQLGYEEMQSVGAAVGPGGVIAIADDTGIAQIIEQVTGFAAHESCGKCTPCRDGAPQLADLFIAARRGVRGERGRYQALVEALAQTSLCGHGRGIAEFARSIERHFAQELAACLK